MSLKVKKSKANKTNLFSEIDLFTGSGIPIKDRKAIAEDIGEILIDETLKAVGAAKSPLKKKSWQELSLKYKKFKQSKNLSGKPDLEFRGDLLDSLKVEPTRSGVRIGHINSSQARKADGHNNFTGKSQLPTRRYIPKAGDAYRGDVEAKIRSIITEAKAKNVKLPKNRLRSVTTKGEFFNIMEEIFPGATRTEIKDAIALSPALLDELDEFDLLDMIG